MQAEHALPKLDGPLQSKGNLKSSTEVWMLQSVFVLGHFIHIIHMKYTLPTIA
jgi:hypothetical protein